MVEFNSLRGRGPANVVEGYKVDGEWLRKIKRIHVGPGVTNAEHDTGWDLPAHCIVHEVYLYVKTIEATGSTKTLDVGLLSSETNGDADGFLDGVSIATAGLVYPAATYHATGYVTATTFGVLLAKTVTGSSTSIEGRSDRLRHLSDSIAAKSVTYSPANALTEFEGDIFIEYTQYDPS